MRFSLFKIETTSRLEVAVEVTAKESVPEGFISFISPSSVPPDPIEDLQTCRFGVVRSNQTR